MDKFAVDYSTIEKDLNRPKFYKYEDVKDKLVKVAFDVVRFMDTNEDIDGLWQIQKTDDGEVIVAMYDTPDSKEIKAESDWHVFPDRKNASINIFYKNEPIKRIASEELGIDGNSLPSLCKDVEVKLSSDLSFRVKLLKELPREQATDLLRTYPEMAK